jgi:hypothetical protein
VGLKVARQKRSVHEHNATVSHHIDLVNVEIAGRVRHAGHIVPSGPVLPVLGTGRMFSKRQTCGSRQRACAAGHLQTHGRAEALLESHALLVVDADQI